MACISMVTKYHCEMWYWVPETTSWTYIIGMPVGFHVWCSNAIWLNYIVWGSLRLTQSYLLCWGWGTLTLHCVTMLASFPDSHQAFRHLLASSEKLGNEASMCQQVGSWITCRRLPEAGTLGVNKMYQLYICVDCIYQLSMGEIMINLQNVKANCA